MTDAPFVSVAVTRTRGLPLALSGFHLARLAGTRSYTFPSSAARDEHYETIHRVTIGEPA